MQARDALRDIVIQPPVTAAEEAVIINLTAGEIAEGVASGKVRSSTGEGNVQRPGFESDWLGD